MLITKSEFQKKCKLIWLTSVLRLIRKGVITENSDGLIDIEYKKNKVYMENRKIKLALNSKIESENINIMDVCGDEIIAMGKKIVTKTEFKNMFKLIWLSSISHLLKNKVIVANSNGLINLEDEENKKYIKNRKVKLALSAK